MDAESRVMCKQQHWSKGIYALYKGEELIADGTIPEIAEKTGRTVEGLKYMRTLAYENKVKKRRTVNPTTIVYIPDIDL